MSTPSPSWEVCWTSEASSTTTSGWLEVQFVPFTLKSRLFRYTIMVTSCPLAILVNCRLDLWPGENFGNVIARLKFNEPLEWRSWRGVWWNIPFVKKLPFSTLEKWRVRRSVAGMWWKEATARFSLAVCNSSVLLCVKSVLSAAVNL